MRIFRGVSPSNMMDTSCKCRNSGLSTPGTRRYSTASSPDTGFAAGGIPPKTRTTKNNTLMAYVMLEDETASMELLCFQKVIDRCGSYMLPNLAVLVKGRISVRDEKPPQILCDEIYPLEDAGKAAAR